MQRYRLLLDPRQPRRTIDFGPNTTQNPLSRSSFTTPQVCFAIDLLLRNYALQGTTNAVTNLPQLPHRHD